MEFQDRQIREAESRLPVAKGSGDVKMESDYHGHRLSFWSVKMFCNWIVVMVVQLG